METCKYAKIINRDGVDTTYCSGSKDFDPCVGFNACKDYQQFHKGSESVMTNKPDMVNHPPHYKTKTGLETIEVIEAFTEDLTGIEAVDTANVLKYICRWKKKNGLQDLEKAQWYLNNLINHLKKESKDHE